LACLNYSHGETAVSFVVLRAARTFFRGIPCCSLWPPRSIYLYRETPARSGAVEDAAVVASVKAACALNRDLATGRYASKPVPET
jgi:hypothetical protein